jgi:predicted transcriptional regulator
MSDPERDKILTLTGQIVAAHLSHNNVAAEAVPNLINAVFQSLMNVGQAAATPQPEKKKLEPAVSPRRSVFAKYIICLEDGKRMKMLRRHLKMVYNLTPEQYRERWNLPPDYPMTAPDYAKQRSKLAKQMGLGTQARKNTKNKTE